MIKDNNYPKSDFIIINIYILNYIIIPLEILAISCFSKTYLLKYNKF